jgi:Domain of unknown function (DUF5054)
MRRREFLNASSLALGGFVFSNPFRPLTLRESLSNTAVKRVLVVFKCHFDAGFIDTQSAVVGRYFNQYFPQAIRIAEQCRQSGKEHYVWTTGSWLLYEYLEQASAGKRREMEEAIARGDIAWHAIPFTWQTEMLSASEISASIALSHSLDRRFGRVTTGAKMTDVPGHTRGIIAPLCAEGVKFLDIGVNDASTPAELPPLFLWKNAVGQELIVMYHHGYGGVTQVPGADFAIDIEVRDDNSGPHPQSEIQEIYSKLRRKFPNAQISASTLSEMAAVLEPFREKFPVFTGEIGDSWIYGVGSDPTKVARYREISRLRSSWIAAGRLQAGDATDIAFLRKLLLEVEHTWGADTKTWIDFDHYTPVDLAKMRGTKGYQVMERSWAEKRQDLLDAVAALPLPLRMEAENTLQALSVKAPQFREPRRQHTSVEMENQHLIVSIDAHSGAIRRLFNKNTQREWAAADHPIGLISYQTLSAEDYDRFFAAYIKSTEDWARKDFGKPNMDHFGAVSREWHPAVLQLELAQDAHAQRVLVRLEFQDVESAAKGQAAFPKEIYLEYVLRGADGGTVSADVYSLHKPATRMSEALWLSFHPTVSDECRWIMDKAGEPVSALDVVSGGSRQMHAVSSHCLCHDRGESLVIETLDSPLFAFGAKSSLNFSRRLPELSRGIHCNLFNNAWGTNYIMWFGEDTRSRFRLRLETQKVAELS